MSRNNSGSYGHRCRHVGHGEYEISWTYDRKYVGSRLRYPQTLRRRTDEAGARRFCKRWGVEIKGEPGRAPC